MNIGADNSCRQSQNLKPKSAYHSHHQYFTANPLIMIINKNSIFLELRGHKFVATRPWQEFFTKGELNEMHEPEY